MVDEKIVEGKQAERWTKKPVTVEVLLWTGRNAEEVKRFCPAAWMDAIGQLIIPTLEGNHQASVGDYIIKGVKGEFYPCKPDIFAATYTRAASTPEAAGRVDDQYHLALMGLSEKLAALCGEKLPPTTGPGYAMGLAIRKLSAPPSGEQVTSKIAHHNA